MSCDQRPDCVSNDVTLRNRGHGDLCLAVLITVVTKTHSSKCRAVLYENQSTSNVIENVKGAKTNQLISCFFSLRK